MIEYACRRFYFAISDSGSHPDISTASNAASHFARRGGRVFVIIDNDAVIAFDATPKNNMNETSDAPHFYTYILYSQKDKGFYIGFTTNIKQRILLHSKGQVPSTKDRRPLKLIHYEYFINEDDAKAREEFLKSGYGRAQLSQILKRTLVFRNKLLI